MRKKIAVFAGGWSFEYVQEVLSGIAKVAGEADIDVFTFVNYSLRWESPAQCEAEFNIFTLPDLDEFDGIIVLGNSFNLTMETEYFKEKLKSVKCPVVSLEYEFEGVPSVFTDNYAGMKELVEHIVTEHGVREILFVGGPEDHADSAERLRAVKEVAQENGFSLPEENVKYGDWGMASAMEQALIWMEENDNRLPDAIVCANDIMAFGVANRLGEMGYHVPEDVIVTGYDCLTQTREFHPILASVSHEWGSMGVKAIHMLLDSMQGKKIENVLLNTRFIPNESCGCAEWKTNAHQDETFFKLRDSIALDSHFRSIYLYIRKNENMEELSDSLSTLFEREHDIEGENFTLCLDSEFFHIEEGDANLRTRGYNDDMAVVGTVKDGQKKPPKIMKKKDAIFYLAKNREVPGVYMYVPVYSDEKTYGFAVLTGDLEIIHNNRLYIWTRHMNQYLEQVRRNIMIVNLTERLTNLSVMDTLTGVYNRAGCERITYPMLEDWKEKGGLGVIFLVDIDKMKSINDQSGHANGDLALRTVASVLRAEMPRDWVVSRFGGDEFLVGGRVVDGEIDIDGICQAVQERLAKEVEKRGIEFRLTVSVGGVPIRPEDEFDIEKYLQMADESMYRMKDNHHKIMEEVQ